MFVYAPQRQMLPAMAFLMSSSVGLLEQRNRPHDLAAGAVAALIAVVLDKCCLHGVQIFRLSNAFNRGDLVALVHHCEGEAAVHAAAVHMHGACATLAVVAAFL